MPKKQSTAAKRARAAAREGTKYTAALRVQPSPDTVARYGWDDQVVTALSEIVADNGSLSVGTAWLEPQPAGRDRWGGRRPTMIGYLVTEYEHQVDASRAFEKGTRIPVPHRTADGLVQVAALSPLVYWTEDSPGWQWAHTGWGVEEADGQILDGFNPIAPSADLPFEVRVFHRPGGVVGEDYTGTEPGWEVWAWCAEQAHAVELAQAAVDHQDSRVPQGSGYVRAQVWRHLGYPNDLPELVHTADADPARPLLPRLPFDAPVPGRPASAGPTPEPAWRSGAKNRPAYELVVWTPGEGWVSFAWFTGGRSLVGVAADLLRVGVGGPYPFAETWGPRHPDAWAHDWTQEGRSLTDHYPAMPYAEQTVLSDTARTDKDRHLAVALADRSGGRLTVDQAAARIEAGGQRYRDFLRIGQVVLVDVLNRERRGLPEGPERTAVRQLLDDLEDRHQVPAGYAERARQLLDDDTDSRFTPEAQAHRRRALEEYLAPDPATTGVPGLAG
jgi:hypothetical protein